MHDVLTIKEAAARLGVGPSFIQRRCRSGELPAFRVGSDYRIHLADFEAWFEGQQAVSSSQLRAAGPVAPAPDLLSELEEWFSYMEHVKALAPDTVRTYRERLRGYLRGLSAVGSTAVSVELMFDRQTLITVFSRIPPASFSVKMNTYNALTSLGKFLIMQDRLAVSALDTLKLVKPRRQAEPRRTCLKPDDVSRLFDTIMTRPNAPTDNITIAAMVGCMVYGGLRVSEVCNLRPTDVDLVARVLSVVHGKGGKNRRVGISSPLHAYLRSYADIRPRGRAYFVQAHGEPYDRNMLAKRIRVIARLLGVDITCHGLRRTFATVAAAQGRSVSYLRLALGHTNLSTTQAYLRTTEAEMVDEMKGW